MPELEVSPTQSAFLKLEEDVLLREIDDSIRFVDAALEELEREEALRVRQVRRAPRD
jgi:vacuolar-type H+-ATPase subunit D/Vma8